MGPNTYTPNQGLTPQGVQQNQQVGAMQAQIAAGQPLNQQQFQATTSAYGTANNALANMQTPGTRQQYLDNTNIGAMQGNYDQLAQQLAQYDKVSLMPQFAGQNPGMPTDLPDNPYVTMGNVSYLTPQSSQLPASQGIYNANPGYALTSQINQGNNIVDLLNTINGAIGKQNEIGTNKYSSDIRSASSLLGSLKDILGLNNDLEMKKLELAKQAQGKSEDRYNNVVALAGKLVTDLSTGETQWGDAWQQIRSYADRYGLQLDPSEIDTLLHGKYDASDPDGSLGQTTGWAKPGAYQQRLLDKSGANLTKQLALQPIQQVIDAIRPEVKAKTGSSTALSTLSKLNTNILGMPLGTMMIRGNDEQELADLESQYFTLVQKALTVIQGTRPSDYDVKSYQSKLGPSIVNSPKVNEDRIKNLRNLMGIGGTAPPNTPTSNDPLGIR